MFEHLVEPICQALGDPDPLRAKERLCATVNMKIFDSSFISEWRREDIFSLLASKKKQEAFFRLYALSNDNTAAYRALFSLFIKKPKYKAWAILGAILANATALLNCLIENAEDLRIAYELNNDERFLLHTIPLSETDDFTILQKLFMKNKKLPEKIQRHDHPQKDFARNDYNGYRCHKASKQKKIPSVFEIDARYYSLPFSLVQLKPYDSKDKPTYYAILDNHRAENLPKPLGSYGKVTKIHNLLVYTPKNQNCIFLHNDRGFALKKLMHIQAKNNQSYHKELFLNHSHFRQDLILGHCGTYILMPYLGHQTLDIFLKEHPLLTASERLLLAYRLCQELRAFIQLGYYHADLKHNNVIVDAEGKPHLIDFGLSYAIKSNEHTFGSPYCIGPEYLDFILYDILPPRSCQERCEIFSLGMLVALIGGYDPFVYRYNAYQNATTKKIPLFFPYADKVQSYQPFNQIIYNALPCAITIASPEQIETLPAFDPIPDLGWQYLILLRKMFSPCVFDRPSLDDVLFYLEKMFLLLKNVAAPIVINEDCLALTETISKKPCDFSQNPPHNYAHLISLFSAKEKKQMSYIAISNKHAAFIHALALNERVVEKTEGSDDASKLFHT